jgi:hypothetical protein
MRAFLLSMMVVASFASSGVVGGGVQYFFGSK